MNNEFFYRLISLPESEYLDFKLKFHDRNVDLIHDILCMANSRWTGDRYIIYGIDDKGQKIGIHEDPRLNQNGIVQMLRRSKPNRSIYNDIRFSPILYNAKKFWVLTIRDRPDKPFFLTTDYNEGNGKGPKTIKSGVTYTRNADGNTPIDSTASDDEIELMWRERFGLDLPPFKRFLNYLDNIPEWKEVESEYYYIPFPEYRIHYEYVQIIDKDVPLNDQWIPKLWLLHHNIQSATYELRYNNLLIDKVVIWWFDGFKYLSPLPDTQRINNSYTWSLNRNSLSYKVSKMVASRYEMNIDRFLKDTKICIISDG